MYSNDTDESLLPAISRGDMVAFELLYDRYSPAVYALLLRIVANPEDAQEVLQETFVKAWSSARMYDSTRGSDVAWLLTIARSRAIDRLRSRRIRSDRENDAGREISINPANVSRSGIDDVIAIERRELVRSALVELPEAQRTALELAYFDGLSQSEIADRLGEPLGTVKTRMQLGMKKLRDRLRTAIGR
jgi:RNA polymerase sigma-70 factor (ECF subfamily)